jgi:hypothetical protein
MYQSGECKSSPFLIGNGEESNENCLKIKFLTATQVEHILIQEIKKQEPYLVEEKRQLRLRLTPQVSSGGKP